MYRRVHKGKHVLGIGLQVRRERFVHLLRERNTRHQQTAEQLEPATVPFEDDEPLPSTQPDQHYHIANDTRHKVHIARWLDKNKNDPALHVRLFNFSIRW